MNTIRCLGMVFHLNVPRRERHRNLLLGLAAACFMGMVFTFYATVIENPERDVAPGWRRRPVMSIDIIPLKERQKLSEMRSKMLKEQKKPSDAVYHINTSVSDAISVNRAIPDTRPAGCKVSYSTSATATIIIPFYNEALSMLLRTIHSILNRTPHALLDQIIIVDDHSTHTYLHKTFAEYVSHIPKVLLMRNPKREGLIRSRMRGARAATSDVIIFQDGHTEVNEGWLEPLLHELLLHPNAILQPFIDGIDAATLEYTAPSVIYKGAFSWDLRYTWLRVPEHTQRQSYENGLPFFTPTLVGCAIAVRKAYFMKIGAFDEGMNVWGGENIELSFRNWMCGGTVSTVSCSRVAHVFKAFPYTFDGNKDQIVTKNLMRVAETWMEPVKKYFYAATRIHPFKVVEFTEDDRSSLSKRKQLRINMKCKDFYWYLDNVIPEVEIPPMDAHFYGEIMNSRTRACIEVGSDDYLIMGYWCYEHKTIPGNFFKLTKDGMLMFKHRCVTHDAPRPLLRVDHCPTTMEQKRKLPRWEVVSEGQTVGKLKTTVTHTDTGIDEYWCVNQVENVMPNHPTIQMPQLTNCENKNDPFQSWIFTHRFDFTL